MKAVVADRYGPPEILQIRELPAPVPGDRDILVKVHVTTVTPGDYRMRSFTVPPMFWLPGRLALGIRKPRNPVFGFELAGEVVATGRAVTRFKVGDRVFASTYKTGHGAHAEYKCLSEDALVALKPDNLTDEEAAAIPYGGITALSFLRAGQIQSGRKILIYGASGAVGTYAVQLARYFGAEVTGVCSTRHLDLVQALGAGQVIDYTREDFTRNGQVYDIIFDAVGKTTFARCKHSIRENGTYLHAVMTLPGPKVFWYKLTTGIQVVGGTPPIRQDSLIFLKTLAETGKLKPVIDRSYRLEQIVEAHRYVEAGHKTGSVVIIL